MNKEGITVAGNLIADVVYTIDVYPQKGNLTWMRNPVAHTGGINNLIIDLARLDSKINRRKTYWLRPRPSTSWSTPTAAKRWKASCAAPAGPNPFGGNTGLFRWVRTVLRPPIFGSAGREIVLERGRAAMVG